MNTEQDTTELEVLQRLWYYPFGLAMEGIGQLSAAPAQRYRYNGKELDGNLGVYDFNFRWYAPAIGRFTGVDPIAEQFAWVNVFNYAENEPVGNVDLHGLQAVSATDGRLLAYRVQSGQGPTQIAADLQNLGYNVKWTSIVDDSRNGIYFNHITNDRHNASNPAYRRLNMNEGDLISVSSNSTAKAAYIATSDYVDLSSSDQEIFNQSLSLLKSFNVENRLSGCRSL